MTDTALHADVSPQSELDFHALVEHVKQTFAKNSDKIIFDTEHTDVSFNRTYLDALPAHEKDNHNCFTCRAFLKSYAGLVYVDKDGTLRSAVWDETTAPEGYGDVVKALREKAESNKITGRFFTDEELLGVEFKGTQATNGEPQPWEHFSLTVPEKAKVGVVETVAGQVAEYDLRKRLFAESLGKVNVKLIKEAIHNFTYDAELATRGGRVEILEQYLNAREEVEAAVGKKRTNLIWYWSARLPGGASRLTSTSLGEYLAMYKEAPTLARRRFLEQTAGDKYMRPVEEAKEGAINAAEKLIEKLGLTESLQRRAAVLSDIPEDQWVWKHPDAVPAEDAENGVFAKLRKQTKEEPKKTIQGGNKDWEEFKRDVLPKAKSVMVQVPDRANYGRMMTAVNPDAPPILIWDLPEHRNPMSHYVYVMQDHWGKPMLGSAKEQWGLGEKTFVRLTGIVPTPHCWTPGFKSDTLARGEMLILEGAVEKENTSSGLFPEIVIRELYPVRSVIENFSANTPLQRSENKEGEFAGMILSHGFDVNGTVVRLLVEFEDGIVTFDINRWKL